MPKRNKRHRRYHSHSVPLQHEIYQIKLSPSTLIKYSLNSISLIIPSKKKDRKYKEKKFTICTIKKKLITENTPWKQKLKTQYINNVKDRYQKEYRVHCINLAQHRLNVDEWFLLGNERIYWYKEITNILLDILRSDRYLDSLFIGSSPFTKAVDVYRMDGYIHLVDGYIRSISQIYIPYPLIHMIKKYYHLHEYFKRISSSYWLSLDKQTISKTSDSYTSSFGAVCIPSISNTIGIWEIRINECNSTDGVYMGVSSDYSIADTCIDKNSGDRGISYAYYGGSSTRDITSPISPSKISNINKYCEESYGESFGINDIIKIKLDLNNSTIEFYKNGVSQGIAFKNVCKNDDIKYRLGIYMFYKKDSVSIVGFSEQ